MGFKWCVAASGEWDARTALTEVHCFASVKGRLKPVNRRPPRQLSGEANLNLRSLADLAWVMDMEIFFELEAGGTDAGQNHPAQNEPMTTSTVRHGQIKYINGTARGFRDAPRRQSLSRSR